MTTPLLPFLAVQIPSGDLILVIVLGASLPVAFLFWLKGWLNSVQDENPDAEIAAQAKADREHLEHHGHHAHGHHGAHA